MGAFLTHVASLFSALGRSARFACTKWQGAVYKGRPENGEGGGFEISDIPGRGVVCESSDVRKFLKKSKFQNFSELFKVKTRNYNRSRFQYESISI